MPIEWSLLLRSGCVDVAGHKEKPATYMSEGRQANLSISSKEGENSDARLIDRIPMWYFNGRNTSPKAFELHPRFFKREAGIPEYAYLYGEVLRVHKLRPCAKKKMD